MSNNTVRTIHVVRVNTAKMLVIAGVVVTAFVIWGLVELGIFLSPVISDNVVWTMLMQLAGLYLMVLTVVVFHWNKSLSFLVYLGCLGISLYIVGTVFGSVYVVREGIVWEKQIEAHCRIVILMLATLWTIPLLYWMIPKLYVHMKALITVVTVDREDVEIGIPAGDERVKSWRFVMV